MKKLDLKILFVAIFTVALFTSSCVQVEKTRDGNIVYPWQTRAITVDPSSGCVYYVAENVLTPKLKRDGRPDCPAHVDISTPK